MSTLQPAVRIYGAHRPGDGYSVIIQVPATALNWDEERRTLVAKRLHESLDRLITAAWLEGLGP